MRVFRSLVLSVVVLGLVAAVIGCVKSTETAGENKLAKGIGKYPPPPAGITRPKVGCPPWWNKAGTKKEQLEIGNEAADIATSLMFKTKRCRVIERAQLPQLLKEQALEGIVKPEEMAKSGQVKGIDLLMYGKITNFRIKTEEGTTGFGLGRIGGGRRGGIFGLLDFKKSRKEIKVDIGVDIRLVDPTTGELACAEQCEYQRKDSIRAFGFDILGAGATANAKMKIEKDNRGLLLRLAIDQAIRKMLPDLDTFVKDFKR
jgi:curli biogenesis system outer membrane secretion channel CsgG